MLLKLSKTVVIALLAATLRSAASTVVRDVENDSDLQVPLEPGYTTASFACGGQITPQKCWDHQIDAHVTGGAGTCDGGHVTSAVEDALNAHEIWNVELPDWNVNARLLLMRWNYGSRNFPDVCEKTVWNDDPNFTARDGGHVQAFSLDDVEEICKAAIAETNCVSTPMGRGIVVSNRHGGLICVSVAIGHPPVPGRSCYPEGINTPPVGAHVGDICS
ncbi:hypothetical protein M413DRAFT_8782 [Hebeloma cylindrosporum]|uniref:Ecp2 effector protein domain-containing protein n=1 Tax=Hebeloma cylindrosporum TaxID=76867 RepID=A0A0C3CPG2_HEBCY|nr:hypothetical protein M413DRAFT_8782 [Hebeloma cylindrosporum h7]